MLSVKNYEYFSNPGDQNCSLKTSEEVKTVSKCLQSQPLNLVKCLLKVAYQNRKTAPGVQETDNKIINFRYLTISVVLMSFC